jgi:chitinase
MTYRLVGYFENWAQYRPAGNGQFFPAQIDPALFTHINFAFALVGFVTWSVDPTATRTGSQRSTGDYSIQPVEWNDQQTLYPALQALKGHNPSLKTLLSVGGWSMNSCDDTPNAGNPHPYGPYTCQLFSTMAADPDARAQFIASAIGYAAQYGFDGIDIDWEYPGYAGRGGSPDDLANFLALAQEFRAAAPPGFLLTMAAPAIVPTGLAQSYHDSPGAYFRWLLQCSQSFDWLNVMSYDYHGAFDDPVKTGTGVNAPLAQDSAKDGPFSVHQTVEAYLAAGIPKDKVVLGMPTYGRSFVVTDPGQLGSDHGYGKPFSAGGPPGPATQIAGVLAYYEILPKLASSELTSVWDDATLTPYGYSATTGEWVSYDDAQSLAYKAAYVNARGLGGAMVFSIDDDDFQNGYPLVTKIKDVLENPQDGPQLPEALLAGASGTAFGSGNRYDLGLSPSIAVNANNVVVEVHKTQTSENTLWWHAGTVNNNYIDFGGGFLGLGGGATQISNDIGTDPSVALNKNNQVVVFYNANSKNHYHVGSVVDTGMGSGKEVTWYTAADATDGAPATVALNDSGLVVEVHPSEGLSNALWYRAGRINGTAIDWSNGGDSINYDTGGRPSIAMNNHGMVVEVHPSQGLSNDLWYRVGQVVNDLIQWGNDSQSIRYDTGVRPSVAVNDDGLVVETHESQGLSKALWYRIGVVIGGVIVWGNGNQSIHYADGNNVATFDPDFPKVACNSTLAVEAHGSAILGITDGGLYASVLSLPDVQGNWKGATGSNSYCYYEIDSDATQKQDVLTLKTITVAPGAPFLYATLTANADSADFPAGATLRIVAPDGTAFQDKEGDDPLVISSGSSLRGLIIQNPAPGEYQVALMVPANTEFHFEIETLPSKDVAATISATLSALYPEPPGVQALRLTNFAGSGPGKPLHIPPQLRVGNVSMALLMNATQPTGNTALPAALLRTATGGRVTISANLTAEEIAAGELDEPVVASFEARIDSQTGAPADAYESFREFIAAVRHGFQTTDFAVQFVLEGETTPWMRVRAADLYIVAFHPESSTLPGAGQPLDANGWVAVPQNDFTYPTTSIQIDLGQITNAIIQMIKWVAIVIEARQRGQRTLPPPPVGPLTVFAFIVAEAARFEAVEAAVDALLSFLTVPDTDEPFTFDWLTFKALLNNWQMITNTLHRALAVPVTIPESRDFATGAMDEALLTLLKTLTQLGYPRRLQ